MFLPTKKSAGALVFLTGITANLQGAALVAHWTFDEGAGPTAADSSASGFDGVLTGAAAWSASGRLGGALDLRAGGYVNAGNVLDLTGSFTVSGWVNTTGSEGMMLLANHQATVVAGYFLAINDVLDGVGGAGGYTHFYEGYPTSPFSNTSVTDGDWHMLTGVYNRAAGSLAIYVDGVHEGTALGASEPSYAASDFLIGGLGDAMGKSNLWNFTGLIDDVRVYDYALNAVEIRALVPEPEQYAIAFGISLLGTGVWLRRKEVQGVGAK